MKAKDLDRTAEANPYVAMIAAGAHPDEIKEFIVFVLGRYIYDLEYLRQNATFLFSVQGVRIGRLVANPESCLLLDEVFTIREKVFQEKPGHALGIYRRFQPSLEEASRQYALISRFEQRTLEMETDEFAFEMFRNIGALVESCLQPFLREFCAILKLDREGLVEVEQVTDMSLGTLVMKITEFFSNSHLLAPRPYNIKISQWRNIAQHHSYFTVGDKIFVQYGSSRDPKKVELTRDELLSIAREVVCRISVFIGSRELSQVNHRRLFSSAESEIHAPISAWATQIAASIATQGFLLKNLSLIENTVHAEIVDHRNEIGEKREVHCSQFVLVVGQCFLGKDVYISFRGQAPGCWKFSIAAADVGYLLALERPYSQLIDRIKIEFIKD